MNPDNSTTRRELLDGRDALLYLLRQLEGGAWQLSRYDADQGSYSNADDEAAAALADLKRLSDAVGGLLVGSQRYRAFAHDA